jgi:hypothetical protein
MFMLIAIVRLVCSVSLAFFWMFMLIAIVLSVYIVSLAVFGDRRLSIVLSVIVAVCSWIFEVVQGYHLYQGTQRRE